MKINIARKEMTSGELFNELLYTVAKSNNFDGLITRNMLGFDEDNVFKVFMFKEEIL